jgi:hypothetical protein
MGGAVMTDASLTALPPLGHMGQVVQFPSIEARDAFLAEARAPGFMRRRFGEDIRTVVYDTSAYDWDAVIRQALVAKGIVTQAVLDGLPDLNGLHTVLTEEFTAVDEGEMNKVSRAFYEPGAAFDALYKRFVREVVADPCGEPVWWQGTPTLRFQFPNQKGADWKVCYHTDLMLGHPPQELNVWVPLTDVYGANSMCLAPFEDSFNILDGLDFDFDVFAARVQYDEQMAQRCGASARPLELKRGQFVMFDPRCLHATQRNNTPHTRISMDLRVLPLSEWQGMKTQYRGTGRRQMLFAPGHYYDARPSNEIGL